ncbi:sulfurtransferase [Actinotalea sp. Marseille-Q4924]|uniref:sulfurtransferase n=1 Tax=Actinotalea sp. Marseille-Q4924 TaxID=2866571 RepID=UPI001CE469C7|nr:sulfurtransferase [Actinotalea sp. Marseille-Q4924]
MTSALIAPDALAALLADDDDDAPPPLLLDVRWTLAGSDRAGYEAGHLPGAVFLDLDRELASPPGEGGRHPLPSADALEATFRRLGLTPERAVVVYDGGVAAAAARAWWVLRWAGHERVRVLDGGLPAWVAAERSLKSGDVVPEPAAGVVLRPGRLPVLDADDVLAGGATVLLDARAAERFRGEVEPIDPVAGHIPGAVNVPTSALLGPDGRYLPAEGLHEVLGAALSAAGTVGAYCGSGVTAAQLVLALHEVGVDAALYAGSWSHWVRDPSRPVAVGD